MQNSGEPQSEITKYYGVLGSKGNSAILTKDNNVVFTYRNNYGIVTVLKVNSSKVLVWKKEYNIFNVGSINTMTEGSQGDLFFSGFNARVSYDNIFLVKMNPDGDTL